MTKPATPKQATGYTLQLRVLPSSIPAEIRIRHALKTLLRSHGLRCIQITPTTQENGK